MTALFLTCAVIGGAVLVAQIALGLFGLDGHDLGHLHFGDASLGEGLDLLSVRSIAAGAAFFGVGGLLGGAIGLPSLVTLVPAFGIGSAALVGTAALMRQVRRLESDGSIRIDGAVGSPATVYVPIPAGQRGPGKVQLALQGRIVELSAITTAESTLPTGAPVVVVSVIDSDTVEVLPASTVQEVLDAHR
jgi:hypothetical protein